MKRRRHGKPGSTATTSAKPPSSPAHRHQMTATVREKDPDGRMVSHQRTVDTLDRMLQAGTITPEMLEAGRRFHIAFLIAQLDPLRAMPMLRVPGTGGGAEMTEHQLHARYRVHAAMQALGGLSSPAGSCVWHVVGLQHSVRAWATRQGWSGRPVRQEQAQGILIAGLGILAGGHDPRERRIARPIVTTDSTAG